MGKCDAQKAGMVPDTQLSCGFCAKAVADLGPIVVMLPFRLKVGAVL
jgi:hypothetical protein